MTTPRKTGAAADNTPFDFNLDAYKAETGLEPFRFHWNGKRWTMEHAENLDAWGLIGAAGEEQVEVIVQVLELALGEQQYADFKNSKLPQYKLKGLFDAYMKHCNVDPGESSGSTG